GLTGALLPLEFLTEVRSYEPLSTAVFLAVTILTYRTLQKQRFTIARGLLHGIAWGLLLLIHASFMLLMMVWLVALIAMRRRALMYALGVGLAAALVCVPWMIRNYYALGGFVPLRSNFWFEV